VIVIVLPSQEVLILNLILKTGYPDLSWFSYPVLLWYNARYVQQVNKFMAS